MSMHKKPLLPHEEAALTSHGLPVGQPSQLADAFRMGMEAERARWQEVVFDGWRVLKGLDENAQKRTSHQNVSDTLDALVRVMKPNNTDPQP